MALRDQLSTNGSVPDPLRFGLGGGLTFEYRRNADSPTRALVGVTHAWETIADDVLDSNVDVDDAIDAALETMRARFEDEALGRMREFADEVTDWRELPDAVSCYRTAYQAIESTPGAGLGRRHYRDFLSQAKERHPALGFQLGIGMAKAAEAWSTLADYLLAAADHLDPDVDDPEEAPFHHVQSLAEAVYQYESAFCDLVSYR